MAARDIPGRGDFPWFGTVTTRWMDNDVYGHVNNAHYYSYFDSVINRFLVERGGLDIHRDPVVGFVVASSCQFFRPVAYPSDLEIGLRVDRLGRSSAHYGVAVFTPGDAEARAAGTMVHVFVERAASRSTEIPPHIRAALQGIARGGG